MELSTSLSKCMDIDDGVSYDLANGAVPDDAWDIRDCVQVCICARFSRGFIGCVHIFLKEVGVFHSEGLQWNAHKLRD